MAAAVIAALWVAFGGTHMLLSSMRFRPRLVQAWGGARFQGIYSLIALAIFVPLVWVYFTHKHTGPLLWYTGGEPAIRFIVYFAMGVALVLMVAGGSQVARSGTGASVGPVRGVLRITRHPTFMGAGLFGLMHLLGAAVNTSELAFFGGFPVFALLGCWHQDQRRLTSRGEEFQLLYAATSFLPFTGRGALRGVLEMPTAVALGVGLTVLIRVYHATLFGGG